MELPRYFEQVKIGLTVKSKRKAIQKNIGKLALVKDRQNLQPYIVGIIVGLRDDCYLFKKTSGSSDPHDRTAVIASLYYKNLKDLLIAREDCGLVELLTNGSH